MLIYFFGIMDLMARMIMILFSFNIIFANLGWMFGIYLVLKGIIFIRSLTSLVDIVAGILIILAVFGIINILTWIAAFWLLQKGFFSFL